MCLIVPIVTQSHCHYNCNKEQNTMSAADYLAHYRNQHGGGMRSFRGGQQGAGIGDILRRVFRFIVPVATTGLKAFAQNALGGVSAGMPILNAAKAAVGPSVQAMAGPLLARLVNNTPADAQPAGANSGEQKGSGSLFDGVDGVPTTARAIAAYKKGSGGAVENIVKAIGGKKGTKKRKTNKDKTIQYNF
jgi:hypothetical protein